jgi:HKD family nuclease
MPAQILEILSSFVCMFLVAKPFLHSKIYEFHDKNKVIFHGSANLTEDVIFYNFECMSKDSLKESPIEKVS